MTDRRQPPGPRRAARPTLEGLEDRTLLYATLGGQWAMTLDPNSTTVPSRITFSIVPDGTSIGGTPSNLYSTFAKNPSTPNWVAAIANAAALWQQVTGINLEPVPDDGVALGAGPDQQGDPNHGDIRFAGQAMDLNTLADAFAPPPSNGGDLAGDIMINTAENWTTNGTGGIDLETVVIHELGHALGLAHSSLESAVMYAYYTTTKQALTADDISGIQSLYGPEPSDPYTNLPSSAINLTGALNSLGQVTRLMPGPELTPQFNNGDWFYVQAPANTSGTMTVAMVATGFSMLAPRLNIVNGAFTQMLAGGLNPYYNSTETLTITGVAPGEGFYIRCGAATAMPGHGAYALQVNFGSAPQPVAQPNVVTLAAQPSQPLPTNTPELAGPTRDATGRLRLGDLVGLGDRLSIGAALRWHRPLHSAALHAAHPHAPHAAGHHPHPHRS